jgi:hypothetical protein
MLRSPRAETGEVKTEAQVVDNPTVMTAGNSAREQARQLSEVAEVLRRKSEWAAQRSADFAAGANGEEAVGGNTPGVVVRK